MIQMRTNLEVADNSRSEEHTSELQSLFVHDALPISKTKSWEVLVEGAKA